MRYGPVSNNPTRSFIHLSPLSCTPHSDLHSSAHLPPRHSALPPWQLQKGTGSSFLTSSTTDMRAREFSCWGLCSVPGRILSSIPTRPQQNSPSSQFWQLKMSPDLSKCPQGAQRGPRLRSAGLRPMSAYLALSALSIFPSVSPNWGGNLQHACPFHVHCSWSHSN